MAKKSGKAYFGLGKLVSIILCLFLGPILGIVQRIMDKKYVAAILRLFFGWNLVWLIDFILLIVKGDILKVVNA